jgi:hypothetical protein
VASGHDNQPRTVRTGKSGTGAGAQKPSPKRSWTQNDLDAEIREYKAKRASIYNDLVDAVKQGRRGATKDAQRLFGRNELVRALGVKSGAMVSKSPVWQELANELGLRRATGRHRPLRHKRIGLDIALEEQAVAASEPPVDQAIHLETIRLIEKSMSETEAEATLEKLQRGEMTDDQARELMEVVTGQKRDQRAHKIRPDP